jgi:hypothetical protein
MFDSFLKCFGHEPNSLQRCRTARFAFLRAHRGQFNGQVESGELNQEDAVELVQLGMLAKLPQRFTIDGPWGETKDCDPRVRHTSGRLDDVVDERRTAVQSRSCIVCRGMARKGGLTRNTIEILDDVKTRQADPAENQQNRCDLPSHARIICAFT